MADPNLVPGVARCKQAAGTLDTRRRAQQWCTSGAANKMAFVRACGRQTGPRRKRRQWRRRTCGGCKPRKQREKAVHCVAKPARSATSVDLLFFDR